jgi:hypothetical protein
VLSARIEQVIGPYAEQVPLLDTIPGVDKFGEIIGELVASAPKVGP